jgi:hypothetical protein
MKDVLDQSYMNALEKKWEGETSLHKVYSPNLPLHVFIGEAFELACFIEHYWAPRADGLEIEGLGSAQNSQLLSPNAARELRELALVVAELEGRHNAMLSDYPEAPVEAGKAVLRELTLALRYLFNDKRDTKEDGQLVRLEKDVQTSTHDGLAFTLTAFAQFANQHKAELKKLPGFDVATIDEAVALAHGLYRQSSFKLTGSPRTKTRAARGRVASLLHERMTDARSAIRFVFRDHPEIVQRATSQYRRQRRKTQRAKKRR